MKTAELNISPVNMEDRKSLGIKAGDTVRVWVKIQEKGKTRLQAFEGLVLATKHGAEPGATFTVRKVSLGVGIERIFPLYSSNIDKIEIVKRAKVRRAKLYHIREKVAREIKRQMRKMRMVSISSVSDAEEADRIAKETEEKEKAEAEADTTTEPTADSEQSTATEEVVEEAPTNVSASDSEAVQEENSAEAPTEEVKEEKTAEEEVKEESTEESKEEVKEEK